MKKWLPIFTALLTVTFLTSCVSVQQTPKRNPRQVQEVPPLDLSKPETLRRVPQPPQRVRPPHAIGVKIGYFLPTADEGFEGLDESDFDDLFFGADFNLAAAPTLYITPSIGYYKGSTSLSPEIGPSDVELTIVPILLSLKYVFPGATARPYLGSGIGLYRWNVDTTPVSGSSIPLLSPEIDDGTEFGFHFLGGFIAPISPGTAFMGEVQFHEVTADTSVTDLDLGGFNINVGFLFTF
jgi:hypothetical protein